MSESKVFNMDCLEFLKTCKDKEFDLCIADPPYVSLEENTGTIRTSGNVQSSIALGGKPSDEVFQEIFRVSKHQIIFGANNFRYPFQGFIVWEKTNIPDDFTLSRCEIASLDKGLSRTSKMFRFPSSRPSVKRIHPTEKPIELYEWIFQKYAKDDWKVLDPFLGSGNSRIAADLFKLDFIGIEINKEYFEKQEEKYKLYKSQLKLF